MPFCGFYVPFRGTLIMRARRVTHTPTRHQTLPWGSIGVAFKGFRTDGSQYLVPAGTIPEHPPPPHRTMSHDVARYRTLNKQQIGLLRSNLALSVVGQTRQVCAVWIGEKYFANYPIGYLILRCTSADSRQNIYFFQKCVRAF